MMVELSIIRDFVAIFGVLAGFSYYVLTVRNQQKSQQIAEKNRQIQLLSQLVATEEFLRTIIELLNMNWTDYDDFERKYGSDNNPDNYAKRVYVWNLCDHLGYMLRKGLIERDLVFDRFHYTLLYLWAKFEGVIKEIKRRYEQPMQWIYFEYLVEECVKYYREKGIDITVLGTFFSYVPEK